MAITLPSDLRQSKTRLTPALADYLFVESHHADSPIVASWTHAVDNGTIEYGEPHPNVTKYPDHILVYVGAERISRTKQGDSDKIVDFYYAAIGVNQDDYNWVYTGYSGSKYKQFTRKDLILRDNLVTEATIALNTADAVAGDYVLFDTRVTPTGSKELDSVYVMRERTYIDIEILQGETYDPKLKENYTYQETIVFGDYDESTNNGGLDLTPPLQANATPINASWTNVRTRRRADANDFTTRSYTTYINFSWPSVLEYFNIAIINTKPTTIPARDFFIQDVRLKNGFSGATKALITETLFVDEDWTNSPDPDAVDEPMIPESIQAKGVFSSIGVRASLHPEITFTETRVSDSIWNNGSTVWTFPATNYEDWPATMTISSQVSPTAKGWQKKTVLIYRPIP